MVSLPGKLKSLRSKHSPRTSEFHTHTQGLVLKVAILQARQLTAKDRTGKSDPYLALRLNDAKYTTKFISANLDPVWNEEAELTLDQESPTYRIEAICWDHDKFSKRDYLGETSINLKHHFDRYTTVKSSAEPKWYSLTSFRKGRRSSKVSGAILLKFWLEDKSNPECTEEALQQKWSAFVNDIEGHDGAEIALAAPDRPVGMQMAEEFESSGEDSPVAHTSADPEDDSDLDTVLGGDSDLDNASEWGNSVQAQSHGTKSAGKLSRRSRKKQRKLQRQMPFHFKTDNSADVVGVVFLEIESAKDLPRERNMTKTGFDMDPFVITSFSKKTFRTRVVRHSLNPVFNDRLVLQVHKHETQYSLKFTIVDRDKLSGNDYVGDCDLKIQDLVKLGPQAEPETGLYKLPQEESIPSNEPMTRKRLHGIRRLTRQVTGGSSRGELSKSSTGLNAASSDTSVTHIKELESSNIDNVQSSSTDSAGTGTSDPTNEMTLPINLARKEFWGDKFNPTLHVKARFVPYPALRQQFWRVILRHYDVDETGDITRVELSTMLDSLGASLKESTIDSFFKRFSSDSEDTQKINLDAQAVTGLDESLTVDQCIICLEDQLHKSRTKAGNADHPVTGSPSRNTSSTNVSRPQTSSNLSSSPSTFSQENSSRLFSTSVDSTGSGSGRSFKPTNRTASGPRNAPLDDDLTEDEPQEEYLISLTECPLCHKTNMDKTSAVDIVTHLATCASQDWRKVDHLVMGDFVTPSQAQRKWYTKIISKVGYGGYKLGANSANILVQDRVTGQIQEERMSVYVRLGIRMLYKGMKSSRMESGRIKKMLKSMSVKQGKKYDAPNSAKDIPGFIAFHQLNMAEVLDPVSSFKSFNEFFYRKLKPGARPCAQPNDPRIAVSPADCRSVVFNSLNEATEIWVKGQNFSLQRLFGNAYPDEVARFDGGSFGIFRLAPQDYHRFHIPVDGILGEPKTIEGQYYTVNPMAIRSNLDVYGENVRVLVPMDTDCFGRVMIVCVGAMMVGSTVITAKPGVHVKRTDELGYFKFGGSTILLIFEPGRFVFDEDLNQNAKQSLETLLSVGSSIGHPSGVPDAPSESSASTTEEQRKEAGRRIAGSMPPPEAGGEDPDQTSTMTMGNRVKEAFSTHNAM